MTTSVSLDVLDDLVCDPLEMPEGVTRKDINWGVLGMFVVMHVLAACALVPALFSWSGLGLSVLGLFAFGLLGINLCYHRLLTHGSFKTSKRFEHFLTLLAFCSMEGSSIHWVGAHRMHHKHSDHRPDPHSPLVNFIWSHVGWMVYKNPAIDDRENLKRFANDLWKDDFHRWFDVRNKFLLVYLAHALCFFAAGCAYGGLQIGLSWLVWGVFVRTVVVWHVTWSINSLTHLFGYCTYKSSDDSRNNWVFGWLAFGEGWHNNHHAHQSAASNQHKWWEIDTTYYVILVLEFFGLVYDVNRPNKERLARKEL